MDYNSVIMILGIMFWVLLALALVLCFAWMYIQLTYLQWDKQDRMKNTIEDKVEELLNDKELD